jgi:hypothetical protein
VSSAVARIRGNERNKWTCLTLHLVHVYSCTTHVLIGHVSSGPCWVQIIECFVFPGSQSAIRTPAESPPPLSCRGLRSTLFNTACETSRHVILVTSGMPRISYFDIRAFTRGAAGSKFLEYVINQLSLFCRSKMGLMTSLL